MVIVNSVATMHDVIHYNLQSDWSLFVISQLWTFVFSESPIYFLPALYLIRGK